MDYAGILGCWDEKKGMSGYATDDLDG